MAQEQVQQAKPAATEQKSATTQSEQTPIGEKKSKWWLWVVIVLAIVAIGVGIYFWVY